MYSVYKKKDQFGKNKVDNKQKERPSHRGTKMKSREGGEGGRLFQQTKMYLQRCIESLSNL